MNYGVAYLAVKIFSALSRLVNRINAIQLLVSAKADAAATTNALAAKADAAATQSALDFKAAIAYVDAQDAANKLALKNELLNGAGAAFDSFKELQDKFATDEGIVLALTNLVGTKADLGDTTGTPSGFTTDYETFVVNNLNPLT